MNDRAQNGRSGPILFVANGNINGRVIRLLADRLYAAANRPVRVVATSRLTSINTWPDERTSPHRVTPEVVTWEGAQALVTSAPVLVVPTSWDWALRQLVGTARRAGTPVVCIVADLGYGLGKILPADGWELPDRLCVSDPVTKALLVAGGVPASIIRHAGSPFVDEFLASPPLAPAPDGPLRIGILANPDGRRETLLNRDERWPEDVLPAVHHAMSAFPGAQITVRLHPRQRPERIAESFVLPPAAHFDPFPATSTYSEFLAAHHAIVGSYSMGLMAARLLGRPAVSYQPMQKDDGLRREIFAAWDIPVASDPRALSERIAERLQTPGEELDLDTLLFAPGRSLDTISRIILEAEHTSPSCHTVREPEMATSQSSVGHDR